MTPEGPIVSLLPGATEMLFGLGLGSRVAAVSHQCDFPPAVEKLPRVTTSRVDSQQTSRDIDRQVHSWAAQTTALYRLDEKQIRDLQPDLIITQAHCDVCAVRYQDVERMVNTAPELQHTRLLSLQATRLADILGDIQRVGEATATETEAQGWQDRLQQRLQSIHNQVSRASRRPRTVCVEWLDPLMLAANWTPDLIQAAGGENGLTQAGHHSIYNNWEDVRTFDPDVLLLAPCGLDLPHTLSELSLFTAQSGWASLKAVRQRQVFALDGNTYLHRSGPRVVETIELLAHLLHPNLCPAPKNTSARLRWQQV
ncbi:MAG: cobalamin-binding protein [Planctomycetaceae bacterium]|nr:cobalamin-binding protein [Planctomycetaceae bacterium]